MIPTYGRERVLVETCAALMELSPAPREIVLVDQTERHDEATRTSLEQWRNEGKVRLVKLDTPSIAHAMNTGLLCAEGDIVLFLDDDIVPDRGLFAAHVAAHHDDKGEVIAGSVIQPWDLASSGMSPGRREGFDFTGEQGQYIDQFMGGNVSMRRECALSVGGVDENFVQVAYRFEREWADRFLAAGMRIWYEPAARIEHLKADAGGTRSYAKRRMNPGHGVGEYYYLLRSPRVTNRAGAFARRVYRAIANRYHALRPWMIPVTFAVELMAMAWAVAQFSRGPKLIGQEAVPWK